MGARILEHPASLLIVLLIVVLLFGWKRLPDAARSVGRSMRIFKSEVSEMKNDGKASDATVEGETLNAQQAAAAEARRKAAEARAAAERAEREAAAAEAEANGSTRL